LLYAADPGSQSHIVGAEAAMWTEFVSPETLDGRMWPRTAAIAERFWSPAAVKDTADMYRRLDQMNSRLEEGGLAHIKNYEMMLRRLANGQDITALKTLVDVVEPAKYYDRIKENNALNSSTPYTHVVDAALPDA